MALVYIVLLSARLASSDVARRTADNMFVLYVALLVQLEVLLEMLHATFIRLGLELAIHFVVKWLAVFPFHTDRSELGSRSSRLAAQWYRERDSIGSLGEAVWTIKAVQRYPRSTSFTRKIARRDRFIHSLDELIFRELVRLLGATFLDVIYIVALAGQRDMRYIFWDLLDLLSRAVPESETGVLELEAAQAIPEATRRELLSTIGFALGGPAL